MIINATDKDKLWRRRIWAAWCLLAVLLGPAGGARTLKAQDNGPYLKIAVETYQQKVYASWLGQIVGNTYGLPHENAYIDEPGPETFPFGYGPRLQQLRDVDGAFSDDDTDVEYMYLLQMEKYGAEPTYAQLAGAWKHHIRERVWLANRAALGLMHVGYSPPLTGYKQYNPHWFQIDPQLVNEIWAITAPGMVHYAAGKSEWAARITSDDWGVEPTIHYGAMFAAAFFESDIYRLIDIGTAALPAGSRFAQTVEDMKALYKAHPTDWKAARATMAERYYQHEPADTKTIWNANLNGACGILALLYGQGDFQKTLDMAVVMGFDADNQTATMCGLIALINGMEAIPDELLFPITGWEQPFNDRYINVSRYDLPDAGIHDMALRTAMQGERIILMNGGKKITEDGKDYYVIKRAASFQAPLELPEGPDLRIEVGKPVSYRMAIVGDGDDVQWRVADGSLPEGLQFDKGNIVGTTSQPGNYRLLIAAQRGTQQATRELKVRVTGPNLALQATRVLSNVSRLDIAARDSLWLTVPYSLYANDVEAIRDGNVAGEGSTYYSIDGTHEPKVDYYGYQWREPIKVGSVVFYTGAMEEIAGWFTSLSVEYKDGKGGWKRVKNMKISPTLVEGNAPYDKPHFVMYTLNFEPLEATAIRIIGNAGGGEHWYGKPAYFTSISELEIYGPIPN
ncbi:ADP-ribosylglycohydrolase [Parapedobacter koreensis]|uniref:ADP-ribosylglycohydrolase n=2 Tax=Parapedobacter koreensis TaxID=332977 RepID=A0A1H7THW8_9SPHI|nr:ADP-ribosylglycohydrolase [Parapedobacter koreensis]